MLKYLRIRNLAIIREISLELSPGLTAITGETGAGKSILVDSLSLLLGERAAADRIRAGEREGAVEAIFDLSERPALRDFLRERGWESDDSELLLRREIQPGGRGRAFIGGRLATLADLRSLGERLVDLHGQHEHQTLLRPAEHLPLLDRYAELGADRIRMAERFAAMSEVRARRDERSRDEQALARRIDILRFQEEEIRKTDPRPGETEDLRSERERLRNLEKIRTLAAAGLEALYEGETAALTSLEAALSAARELARYDSAVAAAAARAEEARLALKDLAESLREAGRETEDSPARLEQLEARLAALDSLRRKYGADEAAVLEHAERCQAELAALTSPGETVEALSDRLSELAGECARQAEALSRARRRAATELEKAVQAELSELALGGTEFRIGFDFEEDPDGPIRREGRPVACGPQGWDRVQFLVRTNPGEPLRALARTASGGELSRIMLAIHLVLRKGAEEVTRVFDEVDAGIGGRVAQAVGRKLKGLSRGGQVLCVTHLPQIASQAGRHLVVSKRPVQGRTEVKVEELDREGAVREVARMLGGDRLTEATLRHAAEMVERGR